MRKVYYLDNVVAFSTAPEAATLSGQSDATWLTVDTDTLGAEVSAMLGLTNLRKIFETAKFVVFLSATEEQSNKLFGQFGEQFTAIEAAGGLVTSPRGESLMIFRNGRWDLPKGKLEAGEEIPVCAVREVEEECGITGLKLGKLLTRTYHLYEMDGKEMLKRTSWFAMGNDGAGQLTPQTEEGITDIRWVAHDNLGSYLGNTYPTIRDVFVAAGR